MDSLRAEEEDKAPELSIYGSLFFLASSIAGSILTQGVAAVLVLAYVLTWSFLLYSEVALQLKSRRFWFFLLSLVVLSAMAIGGEKDISIAGLELSSEGIIGGLGMAIRAVTIVIATYTFARVASIGGLSSLFARLGVRELGFLLGIALNLLPLVQRTSANALLAVRLRGGFRRNRLRSLQKMAITILVNSLRYSDDIVYAAESRAFGGVQPNTAPIVISKADRVLLSSSMMVCAAAIVLKSQWG